MSAVILVVDDNAANLKLACDLLECEGHEVLRADRASRALEILEHRLPDLVLMDISMPGMDGLTLTRRLKADPRTRDLVVVALTASAMTGDEDRVMAAGCDGYISKPIDTRAFPAQVAGYCRAPERSKQILVVDDNATNRKLLRAILEAEGLTVVEAGDGVEALEVLNREHVDAVVSDILMPRMDGYRLCYEVRGSERLHLLPFVIYTSTYTSPGDEKLALDMGADRYLTKPAPASAILEAVRMGTRRGPWPAPRPVRQPELVLMKEYSQQLVTKLEERNAELAHLTSDLGLANDKLRHLLLHSPAVIYELKLEGGAIVPQMVSDNLTALLGFTPAETLRHEWWLGQLHPDDIRLAVDGLSRSLGQNRSRSEYRLRHKDGTYHWVEDNRCLVRDAAGAPRELIGVWTDITERKQLEVDLSVRDQQLNAFFSNATAGLCMLDRDFRFVQLNEILAAMNGISRCDHLGKSVAEVLPAMWTVLEPILSRVLATGESVSNVEVSGRLPGSPERIHHWMASYFPIIDPSGRLDGVGAVAVEVTERRNAEEALRESESKFRQFAEHIPEVFWMSAPDMSSILYVSPAYETVWGRSATQLYTHPNEWIDAVVPEDRERVGAAFVGLRTADQVTVEYRIRRPDGSIRWLLDRGFAIRDAAGQAYRTAGIVKDVTERKQLDEALRHSQKLEAIGQLAGGIAHEINTPMQYIGNNVRFASQAIARLLAEDMAGGGGKQTPADLAYLIQEIPRALQQSLEGVERVTRIVASMRALARHNDGTKEPANLNCLVESAATVATSEWKFVAKVVYDLDPALPLVRCLSDEVSQVFLNLIINAAHAIEDSPRAGCGGLITISSRIDTDRVEIRVADNGSGIPAGIAHKVFDPFFTSKAVGRGTGQGLTLAHAVVVQRHGGSIRFETEAGAGTTFIVTLPVEPDYEAAHAGATT